ncbi:family 2 encapsulin nanocompartment cargo protein terpene cyclase [Stackebrandtia nassauensis]|uniref:Terpene synthase n=1 Tax=Stackebrandtia nassauensis (strain DSM 44728 / CIP 108903 / NRRL B-16338 / NBRC 102104 / LLR-40K-21) TaxID=446470 RepID=D3PZL3_STANL|nr:family 2 encapsulin nanocompartment cargo protein terpene cyclase [Stackebrandtia nassauensis]ADD41687.1 terpene synthase, metal-binding protein [Stackebrandtia nassauensis DSM 44728]
MTTQARVLPTGPVGLGTDLARLFSVPPPKAAGSAGKASPTPKGSVTVPELYCPDAVRDDAALGAEVDRRLAVWGREEIGLPDEHVDKLGKCGYGRLIMLTHPDCDDPDRLLAAAKCAVAEWSVDDLYLDGDSAEPEPERLGPRLALAYAAMAPARVPPPPYREPVKERIREDLCLRMIHSAWKNLARYASHTQVFRLRHELAVMFVAYNQEAEWHITERVPPTWEFLLHRWENAFCPCMVLTDVVGGYEVPVFEYADPRVRRVFTTAGVASVLVNDLYSLEKEKEINGFDYSLPGVLVAQDGCTLQEAVDRTAELHDELVRFVESESALLSANHTPMLARFLTGVWNWMGGGKEWHATSRRYHKQESDNSDAA